MLVDLEEKQKIKKQSIMEKMNNFDQSKIQIDYL